QVQAHQTRKRPADREEDGQEDEVQDADPLVVNREDPRPEAVAVLEVADVFVLLVDAWLDVGCWFNCCAHFGAPPSVVLGGGTGSVGAPTGATQSSVLTGISPFFSDLMYAITLIRSSSLTFSGPKAGMIGSHPSRILARGRRIDSRR